MIPFIILRQVGLKLNNELIDDLTWMFDNWAQKSSEWTEIAIQALHNLSPYYDGLFCRLLINKLKTSNDRQTTRDLLQIGYKAPSQIKHLLYENMLYNNAIQSNEIFIEQYIDFVKTLPIVETLSLMQKLIENISLQKCQNRSIITQLLIAIDALPHLVIEPSQLQYFIQTLLCSPTGISEELLWVGINAIKRVSDTDLYAKQSIALHDLIQIIALSFKPLGEAIRICKNIMDQINNERIKQCASNKIDILQNLENKT